MAESRTSAPSPPESQHQIGRVVQVDVSSDLESGIGTLINIMKARGINENTSTMRDVTAVLEQAKQWLQNLDYYQEEPDFRDLFLALIEPQIQICKKAADLEESIRTN